MTSVETEKGSHLKPVMTDSLLKAAKKTVQGLKRISFALEVANSSLMYVHPKEEILEHVGMGI